MDRLKYTGKSLARRKIGGLRTRKTAHHGSRRQTDRETVEPEQTKNRPKIARSSTRTSTSGLRGPVKAHRRPKQRSKNFAIQSIEDSRDNDELAASFLAQLKHINLQSGELPLLKKISTETLNINKTIDGTMETNVNLKICNKQLEILREDQSAPSPSTSTGSPKIQLIPRSKWVYETPDKQRIKRMDELNFNEVKTGLEPAVFEATEKIVYGLNEKGNKIDLTRFHAGQEVPINRAFLTPVNIKKTPVEENQFLTQNELTININEENNRVSTNSRKRRREGENEELNWYEKHMKHLATCRPAKERTDRRTYMLRKSLSFQEETPTSHTRLKCRFRSLDESDSYRSREDDEEDRSLLEEDFYQQQDTPQQNGDFTPEDEQIPLPDSPQLSSILGNVYLNNSGYEIPPPRFYPRRNYDLE